MPVTKFTVTLRDKRDSHEIPVEVNADDVLDTSMDIADAASILIDAAIAKVKTHEPERVNHVYASNIAKRGRAKNRYRMEAVHPRDNGSFSGSIEAVDVADAEFQLMWQMAEKGGIRPWDLSHMLAYMDDIAVYNIALEPVSASERDAAFLALYEAAIGNGDLDEAAEKARAVLEDLGLLNEPAAAPRF